MPGSGKSVYCGATPPGRPRLLFSVRLVSRQPTDISAEAWQQVVADQLRAVKAHYDQGKIRAIYRETGVGVLAIYDAADPREMDQLIAGLPMARYFADTTVHPVWDMVPTLQNL
jgi:muconolactone delta-isomerase